jgi:glycogen(starch) synthase
VRIALVSRQLAYDGNSGIVRATRDLARALHEAGHAVHVLAQDVEHPLDLPADIVVHDTAGGTPVERAVAVHETLARLHAAGELDVASAPLWGCEAALAVHDPAFPTVVSCMTTTTTMAAINPHWGATEEARDLIRLEAAYLRGARHLHGLTRAALDQALADYGGAPLTSAVLPRGLRDRAPVQGRAAAREGPVRLLFVGRLERRKGVDRLLEAVRVLIAEGHDVQLTLVGPDMHAMEGRAPYRETAGERVTFTGQLPDGTLHELLAAADVVCQPSRYESHGIVLVEAMMFGKAIVTTSAGGIPEVVERDGNALLAEPDDTRSLVHALRAVVTSGPLRERLARRSRALYVEQFEVGVVAAAMAELFEAAIRAHAAAPPASPPATLLDALFAERAAWRRRAALAERRLARVEASRSWRMTEPLRGAARAVRRREG